MENIIKKLEEKEESNLEHQELIIAIKKIGLGGNLNSIRSGIDKLDLTKLVANILRKTQLEERIIEFMGIPLHLYMVANILYFDNLNVNIVADLYSLYSKFIEEKILIYVEEKEGHLKEGIEKDRMVDRVREDTFRIHTELANQLFDEGIDTKLKKEDTELCAALGIVSIHGGKALFLHQTFAEFFKAESIRTKIEKKVFIEIISEEKYEVVRSFLSCALETKGFENISEEFSNDLDFLFEILKRIRKGYFNPYIINFDDTCSVNIVKQLVKVFKLNADSELFNKFIEQLNKLINEETDESVSINSKHNAIWIGCYLNVEIIEHLINGNLKCESQLIFGFVRFAENVGEVIDVLKEFISKECESGGNEEERVLNGILEFVRTEDMYGDGLISYAISNERTEIFPCLLEYMRNVLGKEKFIGEVIESTAYKEQMEWSIMKMHTNRNCKLIKEMHSKFINETDILFDFDFKRNVIWRAILNDNEDELGNSFEKVIHLFKECFGIMNLKEQLQNGNSYGQFLVHLLMKYSKNAILVKYFGLIKNVLGEEIKDILKIKDKYLSNILHSAAQNKNEINFNFLDLYLCESELKELLFGRENKLGRTCLHSAAKWNLRQLPVLINYAFELLKSEKNVLEELLLMKDKYGDTFLNLIEDSVYTSTERIKEIFNNLRSKLSDEIFNKLLRIRNENGKTFLQIDRKYKKEEVIECFKEILEKELFEELLRTEDEEKL